MKKLLLMGGSHADVPIILAAQKLNYFVYTTGNNPHDLGHLYSDKYIRADFSDKDEMLSVTYKIKPDFICPSANDFSAISCSYVSNKIGLSLFDNFDITLKIHHKDLYRKFAFENKIKTPKFLSFDNKDKAIFYIENNVEFPVIIKPTDLTGGKGIEVLTNKNRKFHKDIISNSFLLSKSKKIIIEKFITGSIMVYPL